MVRVLSIPVFQKQNVTSIERSVSTCCVALPDKLLVASSSTHCIEVNNVNISDDQLNDLDNYIASVQTPSFSFPTVDSVKQIIHCLHGNYITTIETKSNTRQNRMTSYVRVYANWDSVATLQQSKMNSSGISLGQSECGMVQPMRARIAGRVTPSITQSGDVSNLEMIEIPVKRSPNLIACCQITGNLLIASDQRLTIYRCVIKVHDTSKQTFLDFEQVPQFFELTFKPSRIALNENFLTIFNNQILYVFKIITPKMAIKKIVSQHKLTDKNFAIYSEDICIEYDKLCENETNIVNLPMITKENVLMYKNLPFMNCTDINVTIKSSSPIESTSQSYEIKNILQLKIRPDINVEGVIHPISEEFSCFTVKSIYLDDNNIKILNNKMKVNNNDQKTGCNIFLESTYNKYLKTLVLMLATSQEGYLFHINTNESDNDNVSKINNFESENRYLVGVYSFTTPVVDIILQDTILHALTYSGLESYTLKPPQMIFEQNDPIYLIDLKSFLGVRQILKTDTNFILLVNYDSSPVRSTNSSSSSSTTSWTMYNLEMPSVLTMNRDLLKVADMHRIDSIQTYLHLLNKSYILLRLNLQLLKFEIKWDGAVGVVTPIQHTMNYKQQILDAFRKTCMYLGDYYIASSADENKLSIFYYNLTNLKPIEILNRFIDLERASNDSKELQGLLYYLKTVILDVKFGDEADSMFTPIPDCNHYVTGIINCFKHNSLSSINIGGDTDSSDNLSIPQNSTDNSPFCSSKILLSDQELSGPVSMLLPENLMHTTQITASNEWIESNDNNQQIDSDLLLISDTNFSQTFADLILDIFNTFNPIEIANFVIKNAVIREYATNKIISILLQRKNKNEIDYFALAVLHLQKNDTNNAKLMLDKCPNELLMKILLKNNNLLFDTTSVRQARNKTIGFSDLTTLLIATKANLLADVFFKILTSKKSISLRELIKIFVEYLPSHVGDSSANATNVFHLTLEKYLINYFNKLKAFQRPIIDNIIKESLKLLCRCYISKLLLATNLCQTPKLTGDNNGESTPTINPINYEQQLIIEQQQDENCLFKNCRYKYLEKIPIFDMFCPAEGAVDLQKKQSICGILMKLEAMFCSQMLPISAINEIDLFLKSHSHFVGKIRLQSIILPLNESIQILVDRYPMCLKLFAQERFTDEIHWQQLIISLEKHILKLKKTGLRARQKLHLIQITRREILYYLATTYTFDKFMKTLPLDLNLNENESVDSETENGINQINDEYISDPNEDDDQYDYNQLNEIYNNTNKANNEMNHSTCNNTAQQRYARYIELCRNSSHANQLQQLIIATGQQLLTTLNL